MRCGGLAGTAPRAVRGRSQLGWALGQERGQVARRLVGAEAALDEPGERLAPRRLGNAGTQVLPQALAQQVGEPLLEPVVAAALEAAAALQMLEVALEAGQHLGGAEALRGGGEQHRRIPVAVAGA